MYIENNINDCKKLFKRMNRIKGKRVFYKIFDWYNTKSLTPCLNIDGRAIPHSIICKPGIIKQDWDENTKNEVFVFASKRSALAGSYWWRHNKVLVKVFAKPEHLISYSHKDKVATFSQIEIKKEEWNEMFKDPDNIKEIIISPWKYYKWTGKEPL